MDADMDESTLSQLHAKLSEASHALHEAWELAHTASDNAFNTYGDLADIVATYQARVYNELYGDLPTLEDTL